MTEILVPSIACAVALFFASFLSWMVLPIHRKDWAKHEKDEELRTAVRDLGITSGSYMFPGQESPEEMKSEAYQEKWNEGPVGIMTVYPTVSMGKNLGLTFVFFFITSLLIGTLATMGLPTGSAFMDVFTFVSLAGLLAYLASMVQHSIWFHNRIVGHVIESVAYALITGGIYAALWPAA